MAAFPTKRVPTLSIAPARSAGPSSWVFPDYGGGSIVNLMSTLRAACGGGDPSVFYPGLAELDPADIARHRTVLLMVFDGMGDAFLQRAAPGGEMHSRRLRRLTSVFPSTTAAAITTFLTGEAPQQHGLTGWFMYLRELAGVYSILPARPRCGGATFSRSGIEPKMIFDSRPFFAGIRRRSIVVTPRRIAHSDYNLSHLGPADLRTYDSLDEFFLTVAMAVREQDDRPKFVYAYWPELDSLGHETGAASVESAAHLAQLDERFACFCRRLAGSDTWVALTADHGMLDCNESRSIELSDHPALAETLILPLCGERRVAYCYVKPERASQFEAYVKEQLGDRAAVVSRTQLLSEGYFGRGPEHSQLRDRVGDYTLLMKDNCVIKDWLPGETRYSHIGFHGGLSADEMYVPLITAAL
ncbi:alkaline phosphatase family protein [Methylolobus aquaticus]